MIQTKQNEEEEDKENAVKTEPGVSHYDLSKEIEPHPCSLCGAENTSEQFCSTTKPDFYLCRRCFAQGKYPTDQSSKHFVLENLESKKEDDAWDEEEETLLKEGLKLYKNDWEKIANHVSTRTHDECVLHFLQLPTEDPFNRVEVEKIGLLQYDDGSSNTVMETVAFLASTVDPKVAAAAAGQTYTEEPEEEKQEEDIDKESDEATKNETLRGLSNTLFELKLKQYTEQLRRYETLENVVDKQKRNLEKEKHLLERDQIEFKKSIFRIRQEMAKKGNAMMAAAVPAAVPTPITPAQLQQRLVSGASPAMFMNGIQIPPHLQQQQYHLQMQMQMQQQGQSRLPGQGFNHMMPL